MIRVLIEFVPCVLIVVALAMGLAVGYDQGEAVVLDELENNGSCRRGGRRIIGHAESEDVSEKS